MGRACDRLRHAAAAAWRLENKDEGKAAARLLQDPLAEHINRKQALRLVWRWGPRGEETDVLKDQQGCGRHAKIMDSKAREAAEIFKQGELSKSGFRVRWLSVTDACARQPELAKLIARTGATPRALLRRMRQVDPDLVRKRISVKSQLKDRHHAARSSYCWQMLSLTATVLTQLLLRMVWIDAKRLYVKPPSRKVWCSRNTPAEELTRVDRRLPLGGNGGVCLYFYSAVSAACGGVHLGFATGTTGHQSSFKTQRGKEATSVTVEEFARIMKTIKRKARRAFRKAGYSHLEPMFSFDNAAAHTSAVQLGHLALKGIEASEIWTLPALSPDLHRVIEHNHAYVTHSFLDELHYDDDLEGVEFYKKQLKAKFWRMSTPETIAADVSGLPELYQYVAVDGGWPPAHMT